MGDMQFNGTPEEWDALVKKNRQATVKLYTEEQVKKAFKKGYEKFFDDIESLEDFANEYLQTLTSIELPSDEDIFNATPHYDGTEYSTGEHHGFFKGAQWMRDKILNK